jgi:hypothetical protein
MKERPLHKIEAAWGCLESIVFADCNHDGMRGICSRQAKLIFLDGTPVRLRTAENLSSHDAVKGSTVDFELMEDIYINNVLVAKKGGTAIGTITDASPKKIQLREHPIQRSNLTHSCKFQLAPLL